MKNTNLYRIHPEDKLLQEVKEINFSDFGFKERYDIQEWVESTPEVLGEELLIIAKEFSSFDHTNERPDLIALDKQGNIVVVELKRDDSGLGIEWQAIKYASYFSRFKVSDIVDVYIKYIEHYKKEEISEQGAREKILDFIDEDDLSVINNTQRIILVSHRFAKEVTSAVNWLIDKYNMDITVVQLIPFYDVDKKSHYLQSNIVLPLLGEEELIIKASGKSETTSKFGVGAVKKSDKIAVFFNGVKDSLLNEIEKDLQPSKYSRWAGVGDKYRYFHFWYKDSLWENWYLSYKVWLFDELTSKVERRNKFGIYIEFYKKHLLNKGVTEEQLDNLKSFLKNLKINGFKYGESGGSYYLEQLNENDGLSENDEKRLVNSLLIIIEKTKGQIDDIIGIDD